MDLSKLSGQYIYYIVRSTASGGLRYYNGRDWTINLKEAKHFPEPFSKSGWDGYVEWLKVTNQISVEAVPTPSAETEQVLTLLKGVLGED